MQHLNYTIYIFVKTRIQHHVNKQVLIFIPQWYKKCARTSETLYLHAKLRLAIVFMVGSLWIFDLLSLCVFYQICSFARSDVHEVNWYCSGLLQIPGAAVQRLQKNQESEQKWR